MTLEEIQERIIYRDAMVLALNKPAGVAVHPGTGNKGNLEIFFKDLAFGLPQPPALAHRLDAATSGCLILGRHRQALIKLGKMFENGTIEKVYWAVVRGAPPSDEGVIDLPLGKQSSQKNQWWMKVILNLFICTRSRLEFLFIPKKNQFLLRLLFRNIW